jgi:hypothetical protein
MDSALAAEVEVMAKKIAGDAAAQELVELARCPVGRLPTEVMLIEVNRQFLFRERPFALGRRLGYTLYARLQDATKSRLEPLRSGTI